MKIILFVFHFSVQAFNVLQILHGYQLEASFLKQKQCVHDLSGDQKGLFDKTFGGTFG